MSNLWSEVSASAFGLWWLHDYDLHYNMALKLCVACKDCIQLKAEILCKNSEWIELLTNNSAKSRPEFEPRVYIILASGHPMFWLPQWHDRHLSAIDPVRNSPIELHI